MRTQPTYRELTSKEMETVEGGFLALLFGCKGGGDDGGSDGGTTEVEVPNPDAGDSVGGGLCVDKTQTDGSLTDCTITVTVPSTDVAPQDDGSGCTDPF